MVWAICRPTPGVFSSWSGVASFTAPLYGMVKDDHHRTRAIVDSEGREIAINMNRGTFTWLPRS